MNFLAHSRYIFLIAILLLLQACASGISQSVKVTEDDIAKFNALSPAEAIAELAVTFDQAQQDKLDFYTPKHFQEAKKYFTEAKTALAKQAKKKIIIEKVAKADRFIAKAYLRKGKVQSALPELLKVKANLDELHTESIYQTKYQPLAERLERIIGQVEVDEMEGIEKQKSKLLKDMLALEVASIKYNALHEAKTIRTAAKAKNAIKLTPITYANAVKVYQASEANILRTPYDKAVVAQAKQAALFAAKHALQVINRTNALAEKIKTSLERVVLEQESQLLTISQALQVGDLRDQSLAKQINAMIESANLLLAVQTDNQKNIATIEDTHKQLAAKQTQLNETKTALDTVQRHLADRNNQILKITADYLQLQQNEKKLTREMDELKTKIIALNKKNSERVTAQAETTHSQAMGPPIQKPPTTQPTPKTPSKPHGLADESPTTMPVNMQAVTVETTDK